MSKKQFILPIVDINISILCCHIFSIILEFNSEGFRYTKFRLSLFLFSICIWPDYEYKVIRENGQPKTISIYRNMVRFYIFKGISRAGCGEYFTKDFFFGKLNG